MTEETNSGFNSHEDLSASWREDATELFTAVQLPCGRSIQNRFVKVAMYEHMAALFGGPPNDAHMKLYARWAEGKWGMVCTGNVQVCEDHLTLGRDMVVPLHLTPETVLPYARLANTIHFGNPDAHGSDDGPPQTLAIMQLSHPGRQSTNIIGGRWPFVPPLAPSALPVGRVASKGETRTSALLARFMHTILFQTPRTMSLSEVEKVVESFVRGAELAVASGFDGVQLHAAHGYLISQFMSSKTNHRTDEYGAPEHALQFLHKITRSIRQNDGIPSDFILGIKLNAADYIDRLSEGEQPSSPHNAALDHACEIAQWGLVDFIEVSGGDYEDPAFMSQSASPRQALFTEFAHAVKHRLASTQISKPPLILLTGGLRTLPLMSSVLMHGHADLLGIGRLSVVCPDLPRVLEAALASDVNPDEFPMVPLRSPNLTSPSSSRDFFHLVFAHLIRLWSWLPIHLPKLVGAGSVMAWYIVMMRRIADREPVEYGVSSVEAVLRMWMWLAPGSSGSVLKSWWVMGMIGVLLGFVFGVVFS